MCESEGPKWRRDVTGSRKKKRLRILSTQGQQFSAMESVEKGG